MSEMEKDKKQKELVEEYAALALSSFKEEGVHVDDSSKKDRAHEIRSELKMGHKTICCLASTSL